MTGSLALGSPVRREVETELERVAERWRQLPLDRALSYSGRVRALVQSLADSAARLSGIPSAVVPDLGPATLMDQLTVMVYDASVLALAPPPQSGTEVTPAAAETTAGAPPSRAPPSGAPPSGAPTSPAASLVADLEALRRELA